MNRIAIFEENPFSTCLMEHPYSFALPTFQEGKELLLSFANNVKAEAELKQYRILLDEELSFGYEYDGVDEGGFGPYTRGEYYHCIAAEIGHEDFTFDVERIYILSISTSITEEDHTTHHLAYSSKEIAQVALKRLAMEQFDKSVYDEVSMVRSKYGSFELTETNRLDLFDRSLDVVQVTRYSIDNIPTKHD